MKQETNKIYYIDETSSNKLIDEIEELEKELKDLNLKRKEVHKQGTDVSWDDSEFINLEEEIKIVECEIKRRRKILNDYIILPSENIEGLVCFENILKLKLIFSDGTTEDIIGKLVGVANFVNKDEGYVEISINSPIGKAIYGKKIGEKVSCPMNNQTNQVEILEEIKLEKSKTKKKI